MSVNHIPSNDPVSNLSPLALSVPVKSPSHIVLKVTSVAAAILFVSAGIFAFYSGMPLVGLVCTLAGATLITLLFIKSHSNPNSPKQLNLTEISAILQGEERSNQTPPTNTQPPSTHTPKIDVTTSAPPQPQPMPTPSSSTTPAITPYDFDAHQRETKRLLLRQKITNWLDTNNIHEWILPFSQQDLVNLYVQDKELASKAIQEIGRRIDAFEKKPGEYSVALTGYDDSARRRIILAGAIPVAADAGDPVAQYCIGYVLQNAKRYTWHYEATIEGLRSSIGSKTFIDYFEASAEKKFVPAQAALGEYYWRTREGDPVLLAKRLAHLARASEQGNARAAYSMWFLRNDRNNDELALQLLKKAAKLGDVHALYDLGMYYYQKEPRFYDSARTCLLRAESRGHVHASGPLSLLPKSQHGNGSFLS